MAELRLVRSMTRPLSITAISVALFANTTLAFDAKWDRAKSSAGHFSVMLPKPFHEAVGDEAAWGQRVHSGAQHSFYVGGTPTPGINFVAGKLIYDSIDHARANVTRMVLDEAPSYRRVYKKRGDVAGLPGIELKDLSSAFVGYTRILISDRTVFCLSVEAPAARDKEVEPAVHKFFSSLLLERK